jgi:hypothetical protein
MGMLVQGDKLRSAAELKSLQDAIEELTADAAAKKDQFEKAVGDAQRHVTTSFMILAQNNRIGCRMPLHPLFLMVEIRALPRFPPCRQIWMCFKGSGAAACQISSWPLNPHACNVPLSSQW